MRAVQEYSTSSSEQSPLLAEERPQSDLDAEEPVDFVEPVEPVLSVGQGEGRRLFGALPSRDDHVAFVRSLSEDPDLATT